MPLALAIALLWMIGAEVVAHYMWHPSVEFVYDTAHKQLVQATDQNKYYTFEGYLDTGLTYNYYRDGMFTYFQERTGCLAIAEVDQYNANHGIGEARCVALWPAKDNSNLSYTDGQARLLRCRELWPTQWPTNCALGKQSGPA